MEGNVGAIDGIKYKLKGAVKKNMDVVLVPEANYEEALKVIVEAIEKALETDPSAYNSKEADGVVQKAKEKYSSELEKRMKQEGSNHLNTF